MEEDATKNPNKKLEIKLAIVDRGFVTTYSHIQHKPEDSGIAAAHIFRFENSKIVELWDVAIFIPEDSPNENSMFWNVTINENVLTKYFDRLRNSYTRNLVKIG